VLRAVTGQDVGFVAYAAPEVRARAAAAWRRWIGGPGAAARLTLPAPDQTPLGKLLLACRGTREGAFELDEDGGEVWRVGLPGITCCEGLPDGHRLLGGPGGVQEYDARGQPVWGLSVPGRVMAVRRLPSGRTLLAVLDGELRLQEHGPDKSLCWQASLGRHLATDVRRLGGGNTLVALCDPGRLVEVDRGGKAAWQVRVGSRWQGRPVSVQRLGDGRTLVALQDEDRVVEVDRGGTVAWSYAVRTPTYAQRLPDGHTVIANHKKVIELDAAGKVLWVYKGEGIVHLSAY
jgi:hypothetical protein